MLFGCIKIFEYSTNSDILINLLEDVSKQNNFLIKTTKKQNDRIFVKLFFFRRQMF